MMHRKKETNEWNKMDHLKKKKKQNKVDERKKELCLNKWKCEKEYKKGDNSNK